MNSPTATSPFHEGERLLQARAGSRERLERFGRGAIRRYMPDQHRELFEKLPLLFAGTLDDQRRPWASVLVGRPGFIQSPDAVTLKVTARPAFADPLEAHLATGIPIGLLGIQLQTRRRNRMNGTVTAVRDQGFDVHVDQSFGNCPQYIHARTPQFTAEPATVALPHTVTREGPVLSARALALIARADTFFIATATALARGNDELNGCDVSHRGGNAGFVRAEQSAGQTTLFAPDFRGNFFFNTLGNIATHPYAGLLFIDFDTGDALSLSGAAEVLWDGPEVAATQGAERMLRVQPQLGWWLDGSVPLRWSAPEPALRFS